MLIYEIRAHEEYAWQEDHGLFSTKEKAVKAAREMIGIVAGKVYAHQYGDYTYITTFTKVEIEAAMEKTDGNYWWYRLPDHARGTLYGIIEVEVQ